MAADAKKPCYGMSDSCEKKVECELSTDCIVAYWMSLYDKKPKIVLYDADLLES